MVRFRSSRPFIGLWSAGLIAIVGALAAHVTNAAPANDHFANATVLTGPTNYVVSANAGATEEGGEPNHGGAGSNSVWWTWQAPFTGSVGFSTAGSTFDTLLAVYTGDSLSNLEIVTDNDDDLMGGFGIVTSSLVFRALAGEIYRIAVDGYSGATGTVHLALGRAGYSVPAWSLPDINSNLVTSADFQPKVLVVDFWETICGACVDELPDLIRLQQNLSPEGFTFFGISKDAKVSDVRGFLQTNSIPYGIAMNTPQVENAFGGNVAMPQKFFIDRENKVVATHIGGSVKYSFYEKLIKPLLRGSREVQLQVRRQSGAFRFTWPATEFGYNLESTTVLGGSNWTVASSQVVVTNGQNTVTIPAGPGAQFFRLRKTPRP